MDASELQERIAAFASWQYRFEFDGGVRTPVRYEGQANRQLRRRAYFFEALLESTGGTLAGRRVLDLGCNAGYWALEAVQAGADFVLGIDGRGEVIEQAELVFEAKGVARERYRFVTADVFAHRPEEPFDTVLCLGFLDVTARPIELFELLDGVGAELLVIDTGLSGVDGPYLEIAELTEPANAVDREMVLLPSREAVLELTEEFGYTTVALAHEMSDYRGLEDYRSGRRLAFMCSRGPSLSHLKPAPERSLLPWWVSARLRGRSRR